MSNKTSPKNRTEKSLNTLVLIIVLLSFGLVGSLVYESNLANDNKITGKVTGLERVSGFAQASTTTTESKLKEIEVDLSGINPKYVYSNGKWFEKKFMWPDKEVTTSNIYQHVYEQYGNKINKLVTTQSDGTTPKISLNALKDYVGRKYAEQALGAAGRKDTNEAIRLSKKAEELNPNEYVLNYIGIVYKDLGFIDEAEDYFARAFVQNYNLVARENLNHAKKIKEEGWTYNPETQEWESPKAEQSSQASVPQQRSRLAPQSLESAYDITQEWDGNSMNVKYMYANNPSATAYQILKQVWEDYPYIDYQEELNLETAKQYKFIIGGKEAVLRKDNNGNLQFFNKADDSRIFMRENTEINIQALIQTGGAEQPKEAPAQQALTSQPATETSSRQIGSEETKVVYTDIKDLVYRDLKVGDIVVWRDGKKRTITDIEDRERGYIITFDDGHVETNTDSPKLSGGFFAFSNVERIERKIQQLSILPENGDYYIELDSGNKVKAEPVIDEVDGKIIGFNYKGTDNKDYYVTSDGKYYRLEDGLYTPLDTPFVSLQTPPSPQVVASPTSQTWGQRVGEAPRVYTNNNKDKKPELRDSNGNTCQPKGHNCHELEYGKSLVCIGDKCDVVIDKSLTAQGPVTQKQIGELAKFTSNGKYVVVTQQEDKVTINIGDVSYQVPKLLYDDVDRNKPFDSIESLPLKNGGTRSILPPTEGTYKTVDTLKNNAKVETTFYTSKTIPVKKESITTLGNKITTTTTFADDIQRIEVSDSSGVQSIMYTKGNLKLEIDKEAQDTFKFDDKSLESRLVQAAFDAGITKIENYDNGFKQGDTRIYLDSDKIIYNVKSDVLITSYSENGARSVYENVKWDTKENKPIFQKGSRIITKRGDKLESMQEYSSDKEYFHFKYTIGDQNSDAQVDIYQGNNYLGKLFLDPVNVQDDKDPNYKFNGMYSYNVVDSEGSYRDTVYIKTTSGPFGLFGAKYIGNDGSELTSDKIKELNLPDIKQLERGLDEAFIVKSVSTPAQLSSQRFFANVERVLTEFRGLGYYATLFFDDDSLLAWRDTVDRAFATLYLGTEYWSSAICSTYIDGEDEGIAYAETPQGLAQIGAHIEATRTEQIFTDKGREFIYKITFAIRNGDYAKDPRAPEEMNFNVILRGERTVNVFKQEQKVKRGSTFSRTGRNAIVQDSPTLFTQICIRFDEIPLRWKLDNKELCNVIVESAGEAEPLTTTTPTTAPSAGTAPESEINDF